MEGFESEESVDVYKDLDLVAHLESRINRLLNDKNVPEDFKRELLQNESVEFFNRYIAKKGGE